MTLLFTQTQPLIESEHLSIKESSRLRLMSETRLAEEPVGENFELNKTRVGDGGIRLA